MLVVITSAGGALFKVLVHANLDAPHVLVLEVAQRCLARVAVRETAGISKCYVVEASKGNDPVKVQTDGINFQVGSNGVKQCITTHCIAPVILNAINRILTPIPLLFQGAWEHPELVDVNSVTCNDIYAMLTTYGVEAARQTLMNEVRGVFGAYGIGVDPRHISLIADFMTFQVRRTCIVCGMDLKRHQRNGALGARGC